MYVNVQGGTGAGRKRPLKQPGRPWRCGCGHDNPGHAVTCLTAGCREKRG